MSPPYWAKLISERRELLGRLEDADDPYHVRGDLDSHRHAVITERLLVKLGQVENAISVAAPTVDTSPLRDRDHVVSKWDDLAPEGRRGLLRHAWHSILLAKSAKPGGSFGDGRMVYVPNDKRTAAP